MTLKCSVTDMPPSRVEYLPANCRFFQVYRLSKKCHFKTDVECLLLVVCVYVAV